jgi:molybdopterin-containing oxidoreductase family membrane subunit
VIVAVTLTKDFLPSSWGDYVSTFWDWSLYLGTFGVFGTLFLLFIRLLPSIATTEMKELAHHDAHHGSDPFEEIRADAVAEKGGAS